MGPGPVANHDAVLVVADAVLVLPIELGDIHLVTVTHRGVVEVLLVPAHHLAHVLGHVLDAELLAGTGGAVETQRLPPARPCGEGVAIWEVGVVIAVQVGDEDVVDQGRRNLHCDGVLHAAVPQVEEEPARLRAVVAQLDQHGGSRLLARRRPRRAAQELHPHLSGRQGLGAGQVDVAVPHRRRREVVIRKADASAGSRPVRIRRHDWASPLEVRSRCELGHPICEASAEHIRRSTRRERPPSGPHRSPRHRWIVDSLPFAR